MVWTTRGRMFRRCYLILDKLISFHTMYTTQARARKTSVPSSGKTVSTQLTPTQSPPGHGQDNPLSTLQRQAISLLGSVEPVEQPSMSMVYRSKKRLRMSLSRLPGTRRPQRQLTAELSAPARFV